MSIAAAWGSYINRTLFSGIHCVQSDSLLISKIQPSLYTSYFSIIADHGDLLPSDFDTLLRWGGFHHAVERRYEENSSHAATVPQNAGKLF
jgi:hypothetical protein